MFYFLTKVLAGRITEKSIFKSNKRPDYTEYMRRTNKLFLGSLKTKASQLRFELALCKFHLHFE